MQKECNAGDSRIAGTPQLAGTSPHDPHLGLGQPYNIKVTIRIPSVS